MRTVLTDDFHLTKKIETDVKAADCQTSFSVIFDLKLAFDSKAHFVSTALSLPIM